MMRKSLKTFVSLLMVFAILCSLAVPAMAADNEVRVPVSVQLPYNVAGVELRIQNDDGLEYVRWEKSAAIKNMGETPVVEKDGIVKLGVFTKDNAIQPDADGTLDMGCLVFSGTGNSLTVLSAEYVRVIDKDTTETGVYNFPITVELPLKSSEAVVVGTKSEDLAPATVGSGIVELKGDAKVDTNAETLNYTVAVKEVEELATATFRFELDATAVGEPEVATMNGFSLLDRSVKEVNGKWVCEIVVFNVKGLTTQASVDVLSISAASKGIEGTATATLTGAVLSAYVGAGEDYLDVELGNTTVTTQIEKPADPDPDPDPDDNNHPAVPSRPSINGDATPEGKEFPFKDVYRSDWFYDEVRDAWENGLIDGVTATEFQPYKSLTVAEAIKLAAVLHQMDNEGKVTLSNGTGNWYDTYVDYAVEHGVIDAKYQKYTRAQMDAAVTRAEFVYIFHGAMDNYTVRNTVADNAIPDVKTGDFAAKEIYTFYRAGICIGNDKYGTFLPANVIKRCEVATILTRMYDVDAREFIYLP